MTDSPNLAEIARTIQGEEPSPQLVEVIKALTVALAGRRQTEEAELSRRDTLRRLGEARDASLLLLRIMDDRTKRRPAADRQIERLIEGTKPLETDKYTGLIRGLEFVRDGAAREIDALQERNGPGGRDRPPAGGLAFLDAKGLCAAMIREVWTFTRGEPPASSNREAIAAADALWRAAGGAASQWGFTGSAATGWRKYYDRAAEPAAESERARIRGVLDFHANKSLS